MGRFLCEFYPEQLYRCLCCDSGCCDRFEIQLTPEEVEGVQALHVPDTPGFEQCFKPAGDHGEYVLCKDRNHHCVFADGRLCKIHKIHGFASKPLSCRIFPLHIQHWEDGGVSAELRFICPAVGAPGGIRSGDMLNDIAIFARQLGMRRGVNNCIYSEANPAPLSQVRLVHKGFRELLHDERYPLALRLYTVARILDFHSKSEMFDAIRNATEGFSADLQAFAAKAEPELTLELNRGKCDALIRAELRNLICGYLRDDNPFDRNLQHRLRRAWVHFRVYSGFGTMPELNPEAPAISMLLLPKAGRFVCFTPDALDVFYQFFFGKLDSMHFCGNRIHRYDYQTGLRHLLLSAPIAFLMAAGYSLAAGHDVIERPAMHRAVRLLDFTFGRSPFFQMKITRRWINRLARPARFAGLLRYFPEMKKS